jgi:hypothetical protein
MGVFICYEMDSVWLRLEVFITYSSYIRRLLLLANDDR